MKCFIYFHEHDKNSFFDIDISLIFTLNNQSFLDYEDFIFKCAKLLSKPDC